MDDQLMLIQMTSLKLRKAPVYSKARADGLTNSKKQKLQTKQTCSFKWVRKAQKNSTARSDEGTISKKQKDTNMFYSKGFAKTLKQELMN